MKAKIISILVTEVPEGIQVIYGGVVHTYLSNRELNSYLIRGKTIVAEYWDNQLDKVRNIESKGLFRLQLKHSDWQQVIDDGLVDSGKEVEVEITKPNIVGKMPYDWIEIAQLIPQQKRMYSEEFVIWYSGMKVERIQSAYKRFEIEVLNKQHEHTTNIHNI